MKMSEIDVARDLVDIEYNLNSDIEEPITYYADLKNWTEQQIDIQFNFSQPEIISMGLHMDKINFVFKNLSLF